MKNVPVIKIGIVAVSRDCFPESLAVNRRKAVIAKYVEKFGAADIYECPICIVESEIHAQQALEDVKKAGPWRIVQLPDGDEVPLFYRSEYLLLQHGKQL